MPASLMVMLVALMSLAAVGAVAAARRLLPAPSGAKRPVTAALVVSLTEAGPLAQGPMFGRAAALIRPLVAGAGLSIGRGGLQLQLEGVSSSEAHQLAWQVFYTLESHGIAARVGVSVRREGESVTQCGLRAALQTRRVSVEKPGVVGEAGLVGLVA
jgi:hypothetical protein